MANQNDLAPQTPTDNLGNSDSPSSPEYFLDWDSEYFLNWDPSVYVLNWDLSSKTFHSDG